MTTKTYVAGGKLSLHKAPQSQTSKLQYGSSYYYSKTGRPQPFRADNFRYMLKSHFNLKKDEAEQIEPEEEPIREAALLEEEKTEVSEERVLKKSEVSVRLSWLGKTAEGDG